MGWGVRLLRNPQLFSHPGGPERPILQGFLASLIFMVKVQERRAALDLGHRGQKGCKKEGAGPRLGPGPAGSSPPTGRAEGGAPTPTRAGAGTPRAGASARASPLRGLVGVAPSPPTSAAAANKRPRARN